MVSDKSFRHTDPSVDDVHRYSDLVLARPAEDGAMTAPRVIAPLEEEAEEVRCRWCGNADRIEVIRGPFSALYGNSSGGVISVFSEAPPAFLRN